MQWWKDENEWLPRSEAVPLPVPKKSGGFGSCGSCQKKRWESVGGEELVLQAFFDANTWSRWPSAAFLAELSAWEVSDFDGNFCGFFGEIQCNFTSQTPDTWILESIQWFTFMPINIQLSMLGFTASPFWFVLEKTPEIPPHGHFTEAEATVVKLSAGWMLAFTANLMPQTPIWPKLSGSNWGPTLFVERIVKYSESSEKVGGIGNLYIYTHTHPKNHHSANHHLYI